MLNEFRFRLCQLVCIALLFAISTAAQQIPDAAAAPIAPIPPAIYAANQPSSQTPAQTADSSRIHSAAIRIAPTTSSTPPCRIGAATISLPIPTQPTLSSSCGFCAQRSRQREQAEGRVRPIAHASPHRHRSQVALHTLDANRVDRSRKSPENPRSQFRRRAQRSHPRPEKALDQTASRHAVKQSLSRTRQRGNSNALLFRGSELQLRHKLRRAKRTPRAERSEVPCALGVSQQPVASRSWQLDSHFSSSYCSNREPHNQHHSPLHPIPRPRNLAWLNSLLQLRRRSGARQNLTSDPSSTNSRRFHHDQQSASETNPPGTDPDWRKGLLRMANGVTKDGFAFSQNTYRGTDGENLYFEIFHYRSAERAKNEFDTRVKDAPHVIERRKKL